MTTQYNMNYTNCFPFSDTCTQMTLAASTALPYTVPGTENIIYRAEFSVSTSADVWVCLNGTAAVPGAGLQTTAAYQERIGVDYVRYVKGGDTLSFISSGTPQVGISLLQLPITV